MSLQHLHAVRDAELEIALKWFPCVNKGAHVLDLGAGTGRQSQLLQALGYRVTAVDLPSSAYAEERVFPVVDYDGRTLPCADASLDVVFSSNVLEHISDLHHVLLETVRVLRPDGVAIHILPTPAWRLWTTLTYYPWLLKRALQQLTGRRRRTSGQPAPGRKPTLSEILWPAPHGERGNTITEAWYFSRRWWHSAFERAGFEIVESAPVALAYTGSMLLGDRLSIAARRRWAMALGSACRIYVVRPRPANMRSLSPG